MLNNCKDMDNQSKIDAYVCCISQQGDIVMFMLLVFKIWFQIFWCSRETLNEVKAPKLSLCEVCLFHVYSFRGCEACCIWACDQWPYTALMGVGVPYLSIWFIFTFDFHDIEFQTPSNQVAQCNGPNPSQNIFIIYLKYCTRQYIYTCTIHHMINK